MIPNFAVHIYDYLIKYQPEIFNGGPIHYETLLADTNGDLSKLPFHKSFCSGGATFDKKLEKVFNHSDIGFVENQANTNSIFVRQGWGCTENGGSGIYARKDAYKFGGVGIPLFFENVGIFEAGTDKELPYNTDGEICISGITVMKGYLNNPQETAKVLKKHSDGKIWIHTGDLGHIDEDGQVYIEDRIKNIFMRLGFNVHPTYIAEQIKKIDGVEDCCVVGVTHPAEQKVPVAFIKPADMKTNLKLLHDTIMKECIVQLEEPSVPYEIFFINQLPLNLGGKVDVQYLLDTADIDYEKSEKCAEIKLLNLESARY